MVIVAVVVVAVMVKVVAMACRTTTVVAVRPGYSTVNAAARRSRCAALSAVLSRVPEHTVDIIAHHVLERVDKVVEL